MVKKKPRPKSRALSALCEPRLFEGCRNGAERGVQLGAQTLDDGDDRNRDARSDEAVFNGGCARVIFQKTQSKFIAI